MTKFLLALAERILDRILPTKRPEPKVPPHPLPRDLLHIDRQIRKATEDYRTTGQREARNYCEITDRTACSVCAHVPEEQRGVMSCLCLYMDEQRRAARSVSSPRAIVPEEPRFNVQRHAIPPPPPRKRR